MRYTYVYLQTDKENIEKYLSPVKKTDIRTDSAMIKSFFSNLVTKQSLVYTK
jgi:hypothetical protein